MIYCILSIFLLILTDFEHYCIAADLAATTIGDYDNIVGLKTDDVVYKQYDQKIEAIEISIRNFESKLLRISSNIDIVQLGLQEESQSKIKADDFNLLRKNLDTISKDMQSSFANEMLMSNEILSLKTLFQTLEEKMTSLAISFDQVAENLATEAKRFHVTSQGVKESNDQIENLKTELNQLNTKYDEVKSYLNKADSRSAQIHVDMQSFQTQFSKVNEDIKTLREDKVHIETQFLKANASGELLSTNIAHVMGQMEIFETKSAAFNAIAEKLKEDFSSLSKRHEDQSALIKDLTLNQSKLSASQNSFEDKLNSIGSAVQALTDSQSQMSSQIARAMNMSQSTAQATDNLYKSMEKTENLLGELKANSAKSIRELESLLEARVGQVSRAMVVEVKRINSLETGQSLAAQSMQELRQGLAEVKETLLILRREVQADNMETRARVEDIAQQVLARKNTNPINGIVRKIKSMLGKNTVVNNPPLLSSTSIE